MFANCLGCAGAYATSAALTLLLAAAVVLQCSVSAVEWMLKTDKLTKANAYATQSIHSRT